LTEKILQNDRVCCRHFVSGRPAADWDKFNIDWVPTLHLGHNKNASKNTDHESMVARTERPKARQKRKIEQALVESAAKAHVIDVDGKMICNITFQEEQSEQETAVEFILDEQFERLTVDEGTD